MNQDVNLLLGQYIEISEYQTLTYDEIIWDNKFFSDDCGRLKINAK
jgi:hypothetical protein